MNTKIKFFLIVSLMGMLGACGSSRQNPVDPDPTPQTNASLEGLQKLNEAASTMTTEEYQGFLRQDPLSRLRCPLPDTQEFNDLADRLGGFAKPYGIPLERDAALPRIPSDFGEGDVMRPMPSANSSPTITRPDLVGRFGNLAVYLSRKMGLVLVQIDQSDLGATHVSCALSLPGVPLNVIVDGERLIVFSNSREGRDGGILVHRLAGEAPVFETGLLLKGKPIRDARLFNQTLAVLSGIASTDVMPYSDSSSDYHLTFIAVGPTLSLLGEEGLPAEFERPNLPVEHPGDLHSRSSRFQPFLSASGEYLVASRIEQKEVYSHDENYSYDRCDEYQENLRTVCSTRWKQVPNPDYTE